MRSTPLGTQRRTPLASSTKCASLSVVVVSAGTASDTSRAAKTLGDVSREMGAQLLFVSQDSDPSLARLVTGAGAEWVTAPAGSSRAEMCDLGMNRARGSIVVVRDDAAVSDARWLDCYRSILPRRDLPRVSDEESVVMDTMMAARAGLADAAGELHAAR
jgi:hypothetical protein